MISNADQTILRRAMGDIIAERHANPNEWNLAARHIAERLGLRVTRIAFSATLDLTCAAILEEASRQGKTAQEVGEAFAP